MQLIDIERFELWLIDGFVQNYSEKETYNITTVESWSQSRDNECDFPVL